MNFLIERQYVGPNNKDSSGRWIGDSRVMMISTRPFRTNSSKQERTEGWLGTTNDVCLTAHGEFATIADAQARVHELGFTAALDLPTDDWGRMDDEESGVVEWWVTPEAAREQWDAVDWFLRGLTRAMVCEEFGITYRTTDEELEAMVERAEDEARLEGVELHGCLALFNELREGLKAADISEG